MRGLSHSWKRAMRLTALLTTQRLSVVFLSKARSGRSLRLFASFSGARHASLRIRSMIWGGRRERVPKDEEGKVGWLLHEAGGPLTRQCPWESTSWDWCMVVVMKMGEGS